VTLLHHLLNRHMFLEKDGAEIAVCSPRLRPGSRVMFRPAPGAPWEPVGDLAALIERISS
jgi:hypothetical protein